MIYNAPNLLRNTDLITNFNRNTEPQIDQTMKQNKEQKHINYKEIKS